MSECLFCQIVAGKIPAQKVYENENLLVFSDIRPQAPVHLLIVPRKHLPNIESFEVQDFSLAAEIFKVVGILKVQTGVEKTGYRLVVNSGADSGQEVPHLHVHFLAGRPLRWPPG